MNPPRAPALSILVPTVGRVESLRELLARLADCPASEPFEVVVIDNGAEPPLTAAALETPGIPSLRILRELQRGKSYALNHALETGGLAELVAVLDDDMSPAPDWMEGVLRASRRLPQFDIFSGKSHVVWPEGATRPAWTADPLARGLLFSVVDVGSSADVEFGVGSPRFPSGNHFWFRRRVLESGVRFPHAWTGEAQFVVLLGALGHRGVFVPEAVVGHRIQKELIDERAFRERARRMGREMAELDVGLGQRRDQGLLTRLRSSLRPARALVELGGWSLAWLCAGLRSANQRLPARARALWGMEYCRTRMRPSLGVPRR
jgi:glycosyltransferase involved in cell wall biosynthesis